jgi:hypothetical protein
MKEHFVGPEESSSRKNKTLLQRYEIPVEHLDFKYIDGCKDAREVERILKILRSGEEGHFPDLEKCAVTRLEKLNPKSRALRVETPILRSDCMDKNELQDLQKTFLDWVDKVEEESKMDYLTSVASGDTGHIFQTEADAPIRVAPSMKKAQEKNSGGEKKGTENNTQVPSFIQSKNPDRIKSWEYDKWDKFDVDTELTRLDIETMQSHEKVQELDVQKLKKEQELVAKYMKNIDVEEKKQKVVPTANGQHENSSMLKPQEVPDLEDDDGSSLFHLSSVRGGGSSLVKERSKIEVPSSRSPGDHPIKNFIIKECQGNGSSPSPSNPSKYERSFGKSFIEEIPDSEESDKQNTSAGSSKGNKMSKKSEPVTKPKRRFKIQIEDLHLS